MIVAKNMKIDHIAIWTNDFEMLRNFYSTFAFRFCGLCLSGLHCISAGKARSRFGEARREGYGSIPREKNNSL